MFLSKNQISMINRIIHIADLHISNSPWKEHTEEKLKSLIKEIIRAVKGHENETRIVIVGDVYHNKIKASNESKKCFHFLLNYLNKIAKTYIVAGNHDMLQKNRGRLDSISTTFSIENVYPNVSYMDQILNYKSGYVFDDNVIFGLFSMFDDFKSPNIDSKIREENPDKKIIGLYHGDIVGSVTDIGRYSESGIDTNLFSEYDCVMAGHIHRFQELRKNGVPIVYASSTFQRDFGENVSGHGFVVWNLEDMTYELHEVPNDYRMYKFTVDDYDDVKNDTERLLNV